MAAPRTPVSRPPGSRAEGFRGQQIVVVRTAADDESLDAPMVDDLLPSAAGFFPRASGHYVERQRGIADAILVLCVDGSGWVELNGTRHAVQRDHVAWLPARLPHRYGADIHHPWTLAWLHLHGRCLDQVATWLTFNVDSPVTTCHAAETLLPTFDEICTLLQPPRGESDFVLAASLTRVILARIRRMQQVTTAHRPDLIDRVRATAEWIDAHADRPIQLVELAGRAQLSISRYCEVFRQLFGCPPMRYCTAHRMRRAAEMLTSTRMKISDVAVGVGYADPLYFSRVFRKEMGVSPRAYRAYVHG